MIILGGKNSQSLARKVARKKKAKYASLEVKKFPDGETKLRVPAKVKNQDVTIIESMHPNPNDAMIELVFATKTLKRLGAKNVTIVTPYLAYMRQDKEFSPGEAISARIMACLLSIADNVLAVDPHLHRIKKLNDVFKTKAKAITSYKVIAEYIKKKHPRAFVIGPDWESYQWAQQIAKSIGLPSVILKKKRYTARKVRTVIHEPKKFKNKDVIIIDDIISTGHTMIEPIKQLKKAKAKKITCIAIHGVFVNDALQKLKKLGARIVTTDTIPNPAAKISVASTIAEAL